ncbi:hypothetical protein GIB67_000570 [Kingdonia uniflora]|uniref:Thiol-disulfide oxidoreductase DCC n=1 Tax=Kingdonia uniflora TaxID=39325 RepID=A0A7J7MIH1_9MAGN|nr:hypothetical protein GIB67_000570 [Kingdonia uniflora]
MALRVAASYVVGRGRNPRLVFLSSRLNIQNFASSLHGMSNPNQTKAFKHRIRAINTEAAAEKKFSEKHDDRLSEDWKIKMLYDGECPLCMREVDMLRKRNKVYGTIKFIDISSKEYTAEENQGVDYETAMGKIHAILSDGTVVTNVEAFRKLYEEVGLGWVYAITKYEPVATIASAVYGVWAKYRMQVTGRPSLEDIFEARRKNRGEVCEVCRDSKSWDN